jgi:hypothetical protein
MEKQIIFIMNNQAMTRDEDMVKFSKDKMDKGFFIEEK